MERNQKAFTPSEVKFLEDQGTAEFLAAVFGNVDLDGDVIVRGAFSKGLAMTPRNRVRFLADHRPDLDHVLGKVTDLAETPDGLMVKAQFNLNTPQGVNAYEQFRFDPEGQQFSLAYSVPPGGSELKEGVRYLKEMIVHDVGPVGEAANPEARLVSVKHDAKEGRRNSTTDSEMIQEVHDLSNLSGAMCAKALVSEAASPIIKPQTVHPMQRIHDLMHALGATPAKAAEDPETGKAEDPQGQGRGPVREGKVAEERLQRIRELLTAYPQ